MAHESGDRRETGLDSLDDKTPSSTQPQPVGDRRLIIASNRGPLNFFEENSGEIARRRDTSPAIEQFSSLSDVPLTWVSSAVSAVERRALGEIVDQDGYVSAPELPVNWNQRIVSSPRRVHHKFYNVICNPLLWFLFHRSWSSPFTPNITAQEHDAWERGYRVVNQSYSDEIVAASRGAEINLLCRGYQLMLVPGMTRQVVPGSVIHFTLDTPWPWPSDFEIIPSSWRSELINSLLSADVVSMPTKSDVQAFIGCVRSELRDSHDLEIRDSAVKVGDRKTNLQVTKPFVRESQLVSTLDHPTTKRFIEQIELDEYDHTFVCVDRAEPHKNIVRSINAFGAMLKRNGELASATKYRLVLTPGPQHVSAYKRLNDEIRRAARRINDQFDGVTPVQVHIENNFYRAIAQLDLYDTLISIPIVDDSSRCVLDGIAINQKHGNLILSTTSPAAQSFGDHAQVVDFADVDGIATAMETAISESKESRAHNFTAMRARLLDPANQFSAKSLVDSLNDLEGARSFSG